MVQINVTAPLGFSFSILGFIQSFLEEKAAGTVGLFDRTFLGGGKTSEEISSPFFGGEKLEYNDERSESVCACCRLMQCL